MLNKYTKYPIPKIKMREKCPYSKLIWYVFHRFQIEYGEIRSILQSECGRIRTRITPNRDTFYAVSVSQAA